MVSAITMPYPPFTLKRTTDFRIQLKGPTDKMTKEDFVMLQQALTDFQRICTKIDSVNELANANVTIGEQA